MRNPSLKTGALFLLLATTFSFVRASAIDDRIPSWQTIPSGRFQMGSQTPADQLVKDFAMYQRPAEYFRDEFPRHSVEITRPFFMSRTEITVGQFRRFVEETGYKTEAESDGAGGWGYDKKEGKCIGRDPRFTWRDAGYPQTENHPAVNVSWNDCQAYCSWLSRKENRRVRLPTEAEWEYACRAGTTTFYATGKTPESLLAGARTLQVEETLVRYAVQDIEIAENSSTAFPIEVGSFPANAFGLHDMHGNVWEWTADWHEDDYYARSPTRDPQGPVQGIVKVRRGGGWNSFPLWARASFRNWNSPDSRCVNLGFRVVAEFSHTELSDYESKQPIRLLFVGDIMLDNGPGHAAASGRDPFARCAALLKDSDLTIGNLECVLGRAGVQMDKNYTFRAARESTPYLKKYFHALSLANNHSGDYGRDGLLECMKVLQENDISYFGVGTDIVAARQGRMIELRGRRIMLLGYNGYDPEVYQATETEAGSVPLDPAWVVEDIQRARKQLKADIVIPFVHWGAETVSMPRESQRQLARQWIDAGATAVIGAHPHVTQTVEIHRGAPIVYSLGNFAFDYFPLDPPLWTGWVVQLTIPVDGPIDMHMTAVEMDSEGLPYPVVVEE